MIPGSVHFTAKGMCERSWDPGSAVRFSFLFSRDRRPAGYDPTFVLTYGSHGRRHLFSLSF